ncbi:MAG: hypothetical protein DMF68_14290 [Acidobacteria bacterium]|nr:MAG: hypothetical protein DMF68_14290 [Acidobacteriota bacterium]
MAAPLPPPAIAPIIAPTAVPTAARCSVCVVWFLSLTEPSLSTLTVSPFCARTLSAIPANL